MNNFISIQNLKKTYNNGFKAIDNLSLNIKQGEIFALLGPAVLGPAMLAPRQDLHSPVLCL